jgi:hypothetical protein
MTDSIEPTWSCGDAAHGRLAFGLCAVCLHGNGWHVERCEGQFQGWPPCPCPAFMKPGPACPQCRLDLARFRAEITGEQWQEWINRMGLPVQRPA